MQCEAANTLPVAGGWLDQPHLLIIARNIIEGHRAEWNQLQKANAAIAKAYYTKKGKV